MLVSLLSGEGKFELGKAELLELCESYSCDVSFLDRLAFLSGRGKEFIKRLSYSKLVGEIITRGKLENFEFELNTDFFKKDHSGFGVEVWKFRSNARSQELKIKFGNAINGKPNLSNPREMFDIFVLWDEFWIAKRIWEFNSKEFESRHPKNRPVFHPTSLKPRFARFLVNLSGLKPGEFLLDPFCGVGGILIEAGLLGINATGIELDERWARGARENLRFYGVNARVINANFFDWKPDRRYDAIVTDIPYGKSSRVTRELERLEDAFSKFREISKRCVIVGPRDLSSELETAGWVIKRKLLIKVHRSLERHIYICL